MCYKKFTFYDLWKAKREKLPFFITHTDWSPNTIFLVEKVEKISSTFSDIRVYGTYYFSGEPEQYEAALKELKGIKDETWLAVTVSRKDNSFHSVSEKDSYYRDYNFI